MILSLELKNFRRHEALSITFTEGLNTIRGANEAGKSTINEGILYALYGAKALRDTLAETVTWGQKESALAAKLVLRVRDTMYVFSRSKAGAECNGDDGTVVTGQAEVSAYAAELLGADAKTAALLMMASQSGLRGALNDGPAAVSSLMAKLADFDLVDRIMEAASAKLQLGSVVPFQQKIAEAETTMTLAQAKMPDPTQYQADLAESEGMLGKIVELSALVDGPLTQALDAAEALVDQAEESNAKLVTLAARRTQLESRIEAEKARALAALQDTLKNPGDIEPLREAAKREADHTRELALHREFSNLSYPAGFWEGSEESFNTQLAQDQVTLSNVRSEVASVKGQVTALKGRYITNGKCPTCGHAARDDDHVAAHNAGIDAEIAPLSAKLVELVAQEKEAAGTVAAMAAVAVSAKAYVKAVAGVVSRCTQDLGFYPPRLSWAGPVPASQPGREAAKALADAEALQRIAQQAVGRFDASNLALETMQKDMDELVAEVLASPRIDVAPLKAAHDAAYRALTEKGLELTALNQRYEELTKRVGVYVTTVQALTDAINQARSRIAEYQADIKRTEFNNVLMAKLKKIKPAITDHLWMLTLGAVSSFFSSMRGEASFVTKDKDGFKVNGKSVDSLSGSTIDVLALAVRVALTKTFIPHASFLILDEPASGCDEDRTSNLLGFLSGAGFTQTLLASHDSLSESVADNVISLGA